ncbi:acetylcholine receptor subunit alpha-like [Mya arenaria]|uniref:acetylcholine receptor subunit alpha-like n=1 Tax=Mya arenaria TaxID=6604 RepID=UPI0022E59693|nr:acetylcholine receptor subunit alpha-like [Mya arenaria]
MNNNTKIIRIVVLCGVLLSPVYVNGDWTGVKDEYVTLYNAYSFAASDSQSSTFHMIVPRPDVIIALTVTLTMELYSLGGYDAVSGLLDLIGSLHMTWNDSITSLDSNNTFNTDTVSSLFVDYRSIWTPVIVLFNSADSVQRVGDATYKVRFDTATGEVNWKPRIIAQAACSPDVTFFPFDQQKCELLFTPWFQDNSIITLKEGSNEWKMGQYDINGVWSIDKTESTVTQSKGYDVAKFTITFSRNHMYFTINLVFPVLLLSLLSGMLFLMPSGSGERVGFGITCFLSFVVLLQTIMNYMPQTSAPMSLFCYYVILMMLFTGISSIANILLMKVYLTPQKKVPRLLVHFLEIIKCIKCKRMKCMKSNAIDEEVRTSSMELMPTVKSVKSDQTYRDKFNARNLAGTGVESPQNGVLPNGSATKSTMSEKALTAHQTKPEKTSTSPDQVENGKTDGADANADGTEIDWDSVGRTLDMFFFIAFLGIQAALSVFFLVPIGARA